ncbi:MAG: PD-(D/E)XK nuclease family protein [Bacteroidota bacterium]
MKTKTEIEHAYKQLLNDSDFEKLELILKEPNIFKVLGIENTEFRHSNFLGWLFDPKGTHGLGSLFLTKFLREILSDVRAKDISIIDLPSFNLGEASIKREWRNIDILIELKGLIIVIENKYLSKEHSNQLKRYQDYVLESYPNYKMVFVFLTPMGFASSEKETYINYSYNTIIDHLTEIIEINGKSINSIVTNYITDYLNSVKYSIMENSELNILAAKIYKNHKQLLDVIFENKPDDASDFKNILEKFVLKEGWIICSPNKGYVRFLTKTLNELIPKGNTESNGWPLKEAFLFEINFLWTAKDQVRVSCTIDISDKEVAGILKPALDKLEAKPVTSTRWCSYQNKYHKFKLYELMQKETKDIEEEAIHIINLAKQNVELVEAAILIERPALEKLKIIRGL